MIGIHRRVRSEAFSSYIYLREVHGVSGDDGLDGHGVHRRVSGEVKKGPLVSEA